MLKGPQFIRRKLFQAAIYNKSPNNKLTLIKFYSVVIYLRCSRAAQMNLAGRVFETCPRGCVTLFKSLSKTSKLISSFYDKIHFIGLFPKQRSSFTKKQLLELRFWANKTKIDNIKYSNTQNQLCIYFDLSRKYWIKVEKCTFLKYIDNSLCKALTKKNWSRYCNHLIFFSTGFYLPTKVIS